MAEDKMGGKTGPRYGRKIRARIVEIEKKQRVKQECPKCGKGTTRVSPGVYECPSCGKKSTGGAYYI